MKNNIILPAAAALAISLLVLPGCKKDAGAKEIELPEGQVHIGAQWAGNDLWIESFDPKTSTCSFVQYQAGKPVDATAITLKNCKPGAVGGMMRPSLPNMQSMMNRPGMPPANGRPAMPLPGGKPGPAMPNGMQSMPPHGAPASPSVEGKAGAPADKMAN